MDGHSSPRILVGRKGHAQTLCTAAASLPGRSSQPLCSLPPPHAILCLGAFARAVPLAWPALPSVSWETRLSPTASVRCAWPGVR